MAENSELDQREINAADAVASEVEVVKLSRPIQINGKDVREITLDFGSLSVDDLMNIEAEMLAHKRIVVGGAALSQTFNAYVAARAAKISVNDLKRLSIRDGTRIITLTQNFLMNSEFADPEKDGK